MLSFPFIDDLSIELFDTDQNTVVGYVFASAGSKSQFQELRWVLYREYQSPPTGTVVLRRPVNPLLRFNSLSEFLDSLRLGTNGPLWRSEATYVKVCAESHAVFPRGEPVPPPFPSVQLPGKKIDVFIQIDDHPATLDSSIQSLRNGYVFGTSIVNATAGTKQNVEYWVMLPGFTPAGDGAQVFLRHDPASNHQELSDFLNDMQNRAGATLVVASCVYMAVLPLNP